MRKRYLRFPEDNALAIVRILVMDAEGAMGDMSRGAKVKESTFAQTAFICLFAHITLDALWGVAGFGKVNGLMIV